MHVLCLTETWANDSQVNSMVIEDYLLASYYNRKIFKHGGVAIYVKENLRFKERKDIVRLAFEMNCEVAAVELKSPNMVIVCLYRPEHDFYVFKDTLTKTLSKITREGKKMIVAGDFNLDMLKSNNKVKQFKEMLLNYNCKYLIREPTRTKGQSATCIDNFIINFDEQYCNTRFLDTKLSDHNVTTLKVSCDIPKNKFTCDRSSVLVRNMSKSNYEYFHYLLTSDRDLLELIVLNPDPNNKMKLLIETIKHYFNIAFPERRVFKSGGKSIVKWQTKGIKISKQNLEKLEILQGFVPCSQREALIKTYKKLLRRVMIRAKKHSLSERMGKSKNKVKESWKIVKEQTNQSKNVTQNNIKQVIDADGKILTNNEEIANTFNTYFTSVANRTAGHLICNKHKCKMFLNSVKRPDTSIKFVPIDTNQLIKTIKKLKDKRSKDLLRQILLPIFFHAFNRF